MAGETERGVEQLQIAVNRKPCWAMAQGNLATGLARMGRMDDAGRHLNVALTLQPGNPQIQRIARQLRRSGVPGPPPQSRR